MNPNRDWSNLPDDIFFEIVKNIRNSYIDNLRFRSICYSWRSLLPPFRKNLSLSHQIPFPISSGDPINADRGGLYSLRESKIYHLESLVTDQTPTTCLIKISGEIPHPKMVHLNPIPKHPHSLDKWVPKQLPKTLNFMDFRVSEISKAYHLDFRWTVSVPVAVERDEFLHCVLLKVVLSQTDCRILAIRANSDRDLCSLKLGDRLWTVIHYESYHRFSDIIHYKGKFYALDDSMVVLVIDESSLELTRVIEPPLKRASYYHQGRKHLVESSGDLFLIFRLKTEVELKVFKMQENGFTWETVHDLGDQVLFLCDYFEYSASASASASVSDSDYSCFEDNTVCFVKKDAVKTMYGPSYLKDAQLSVFKLKAKKRKRKEEKRRRKI